jgi:hypothetical protein
MPRYYVTVGPETDEEHTSADSPTLVVDAADEDAARDKVEVRYRRDHPGVRRVRLRVTRARERRP